MGVRLRPSVAVSKRARAQARLPLPRDRRPGAERGPWPRSTSPLTRALAHRHAIDADYTRPMNDWLQRNRPLVTLVLAIGLGVVLLIAWAVTREPVALGGSLLLFVVALMGDRLKKAPFGWEFYRAKFNVALRAEAPPPVIGSGAFTAAAAKVRGTGTVQERGAEDSLTFRDEATAVVVRPPSGGLRLEAIPPTVVVGSAQALIAASDALDQAATPEELAGRVVDYVGLRTVPGLRGLSEERIRREQDLFAAILRLQTLRSRGIQPQDARRLAQAVERIAAFWSRPEHFSDEAVENTTALVRAVIEDMSEGPTEPGL